jgi:hypothetical protein
MSGSTSERQHTDVLAGPRAKPERAASGAASTIIEARKMTRAHSAARGVVRLLELGFVLVGSIERSGSGSGLPNHLQAEERVFGDSPGRVVGRLR